MWNTDSSLVRFGILSLAGWLFASTATSQEILMDHVGNGVRERKPEDIEPLGDLDGDGVCDFILGHPFNGSVWIRSGADGHILKKHYLPSFNGHSTRFGSSVAGVGLMDADGVPDYAIGAPDLTRTVEWAGEIQVFSGATHQLLFTLSEDVPSERFGRQVINIGDVNGDGHPDIGEIGWSSGSQVPPLRIYLGPDGVLFRNQYEVAWGSNTLAPFGDHDGDGCDEYLVGAYDPYGTPTHYRFVRLFSGREGGLLLEMVGRRAEEYLGQSVCAAGDWDGDGIGDIIAGAPGTWSMVNADGKAGVYVFSGADGSVIRFFDGEQYCGFSSAFGWSVDSNRDINGDGWPDLLVGAPMEPKNAPFPWIRQRGTAFLFSGRTGALLWAHRGSSIGARVGYSVDLLEDYTGDGLDDWMVLAPGYDEDTTVVGPDAGRFTIYAGFAGDAESVCTAGPNSVGTGARLWNSGPISVRENALELTLSNMPQAKAAFLIHGQLVPATPFGQGELCITTPIQRLATVVTGTGGPPDAPSSASVKIDLRQPPFTNGGNTIDPGDTWAFQFLYREGGVRNTSNALAVTFVP